MAKMRLALHAAARKIVADKRGMLLTSTGDELLRNVNIDDLEP